MRRCRAVRVGSRPAAATVAILLVLLLLVSCEGGQTDEGYAVVTGGTAERGEDVIEAHGCGACHVIPGIRGAKGTVGPPLTDFARRVFIAGEVPNTTENLIQWVRFPQAIEPGTAMPNLGLSEEEAQDVAAYLSTLR